MKYVTHLIFILAFAIHGARGQDGSGAAVCSRPSDFPPDQVGCDCRRPQIDTVPSVSVALRAGSPILRTCGVERTTSTGNIRTASLTAMTLSSLSTPLRLVMLPPALLRTSITTE